MNLQIICGYRLAIILYKIVNYFLYVNMYMSVYYNETENTTNTI